MEESEKLGMNRTGAQMSPLGVQAMERAVEAVQPALPEGDSMQAATLRGAYVIEAQRLGSVPVPGTLKGLVTTGIQKLAGERPEQFVDKLGERLAFERTGTRMYEALIAKCEALQGTVQALPLVDLIDIRDEEAAHFKMLEATLEKLGADPTAQTPAADVMAVASQGVLQVVGDPRTTIAQALNAVLTAELTDNAGWELLIDLARAQGQDRLAEQFQLALDDEQRHLATVRTWLRQLTLETA